MDTPGLLEVKYYNTTALKPSSYIAQQQVEGSWPNYHRPDTLDRTDGYTWISYANCMVRRRCAHGAGENGRDNCDFIEVGKEVDVAMIECDRAPTATWVQIATSDSRTNNIEVWWFHEVLNLSIDTAAHPPYQPAYNYQHYRNIDPWDGDAKLGNFHYWHSEDEPDHDLLPLVSKTSVNNKKYKAIGDNPQNETTKTDAPGCHGTSGSGVFIAGTNTYLGPADFCMGAWYDNGRLCANFNSHTPGTADLTYVKNEHVRKSAELGEVIDDRN